MTKKTMTKAERRAAEKANKKVNPNTNPAPVETKTAPVDPAPVDPAPVVEPAVIEDPAPATVDTTPDAIIDLTTTAPAPMEIENTLSMVDILWKAYNICYDELEMLEAEYNKATNIYFKNEIAKAYNEKLEKLAELEADIDKFSE